MRFGRVDRMDLRRRPGSCPGEFFGDHSGIGNSDNLVSLGSVRKMDSSRGAFGVERTMRVNCARLGAIGSPSFA